MMKTFTIHEAKTNLSKLIEQACQGEEVVIARGPELVVRLVPIADVKRRRQPGALRCKLRVGPEFFEVLADEELAR
jgi:prevent-host-death family protein